MAKKNRMIRGEFCRGRLPYMDIPPLEVYRMAVLRPLYPYSISPEQTGHRYQSALIYLQTGGVWLPFQVTHAVAVKVASNFF